MSPEEQGRIMSEESDQMMCLLQELAAIKKADENGETSLASKKRRREISHEIKQLGLQQQETQE